MQDYVYDSLNRRVNVEKLSRKVVVELDESNQVIRECYYKEDVNGDGGVGKLLGFTERNDYYAVINN